MGKNMKIKIILCIILMGCVFGFMDYCIYKIFNPNLYMSNITVSDSFIESYLIMQYIVYSIYSIVSLFVFIGISYYVIILEGKR